MSMLAFITKATNNINAKYLFYAFPIYIFSMQNRTHSKLPPVSITVQAHIYWVLDLRR